MANAINHITPLTQAQRQDVNIRELGQTIKQRMTFTQKILGFLDAVYWLSPIGKLHNKDKYNQYWTIKSNL